MRRLILSAVLLSRLASPAAFAQEITLVPVVDSLDPLTEVTNAGDGSGRLFLVERQGVIRVFDGDTVLPVPFLDIRHQVLSDWEQGLLGLTFHPDYAENGYFYVDYTDNVGDTVVSRFEVSANPNIADGDSEQVILSAFQPTATHNGGQIKFSPHDGYFYIAMGDGGGGGDPNNQAQSIDTLLGKILRIDVDTGFPYSIPPDNPYVGIPGEDEIWATGLRNPWRFSFDRESGNMFIGDVGQGSIEEINFEPADSPGCLNYGWKLMEGSKCFEPEEGCLDVPILGECNPEGRLELPVLEYAHNKVGCTSVTGGYVYRGDNVPELEGFYVYGDFCSGRIWAGSGRRIHMLGPPEREGGPPPELPPPVSTWTSELLLDTDLQISSFGEDEDGELYLVTLDGELFRIGAPSARSRQGGALRAPQRWKVEPGDKY